MKKFLIIICFFISLSSFAQEIKIELQSNKITQMIFQKEIISIKGGFIQDDFVIIKEKNILYLQPIVNNFKETNLNVITKEGFYYNFVLVANSKAKRYNFVIKESQAFYKESQESKTLKKEKVSKKEKTDKEIINKILEKNGFISSRNTVKYKNLWLLIKGVYIHENRFFLRVMIQNKGNINLDIDYIAFYIKPKKTRKNQTKENTQIRPKKIHQNLKVIRANSTSEILFEFNKFTIGKEKALFIDVIEKGGERNLSLQVDNEILLDAKKIK